MACRCDEIKELKDDIAILEEIQGKVSSLNSEDDTVYENLQTVAGVIGDTIITKDDVGSKLVFLNHKTKLAIDDMDTKVTTLLSEANSKVFEMWLEDIAWHITHPFG